MRLSLSVLLCVLTIPACGQEALSPSAPPSPEITALPSSAEAPVMRRDPGIQRPQLLKRVDAEFSEAARRAHISGKVLVHFVVNEQGVPVDLQVTESPGYDLDKAALAAVSQWRFAPATQDGKPIPFPLTAQVSFSVHRRW